MDLKSIISGLCYIVIISEMLIMLLPSGKMKKFSRLAVGIIAMVMLIMPAKSCKEDIEITVPEITEEYQNNLTYSDIIWDVYKRELENIDGRRG